MSDKLREAIDPAVDRFFAVGGHLLTIEAFKELIASAVRPLLEDRYGSVRAAYEWRNIPPCHLFWASEPNQAMAQ